MTFRVVRFKIIFIGMIFMSILPLGAIFLSFVVYPWYYALPVLIMGFGTFSFWFHYCIIRKIIIHEDGLEYRTLFKRIYKNWNEIKFIGIGYYPIRQEGTPLWIYFTDDCDTDGTFANSKAFLRVHYRKKIITEVMKFYKKGIAGTHLLDDM